MTESRIAPNDVVSARTPRPLADTSLLFKLEPEIQMLRSEEVWHLHGHNARTLVKQDEFRVVLISLRPGAKIREHETYHSILLHALQGRLNLRVQEQPITLSAGELLALDRMVSHDIDALEDSAFLMTVGWSVD